MEFQEVIKKRATTRLFTDKPIDEQTLGAIIKDAQRSPSWANTQSTRAYVVIGETLKKIKAAHAANVDSGKEAIPDLPTLHRQDWGARALENLNITLKDLQDFLGGDLSEFLLTQKTLFNAPAIIYLTVPKGSSQWALIDLGAFEHMIMLSACNRGIDSVPAYEIVKFPEEVREIVGVPDDEIVAMGIALGYATDDKINRFASMRSPIEDICFLKK